MANLQEVKVLFGGESATVNKLATIPNSVNQLAQLAMTGSDIHQAFTDAVVCTLQTLASLVQTYNPEYVKPVDVANLKNVIDEESKLDGLAYQAYGNEELYRSAAVKACSSIQLALVFILKDVPTIVK